MLFPSPPRSGLLVGLEETEGSVLCLYDLGLSRVVKAVVIPGRVSSPFSQRLVFLTFVFQHGAAAASHVDTNLNLLIVSLLWCLDNSY